jgi:hypothetical protein
MGIRWGSGDLLCLDWFNLYLDLFFEEIMNLDTKCWWLFYILCNNQINPGYWGEGQVTFSEWDDLYVIWTGCCKRFWIQIGNLHIWPIAFTMAVLISNPKIGFDETGLKQDILYIIWPQISRRFRIWSQSSRFVAVSVTIATYVLNYTTKYWISHNRCSYQ